MKYIKQIVVLSAVMLINLCSLSYAVPQNTEGAIRVDGSSTVYPITEAVAEEFMQQSSGTKVMVGISGTGGGFKKFCAGEIDISDASRPIKPEELEKCNTAGIDFVELPVAYDALTVVVNKNNTWANSITVAELKKLWEPDAQGKITKWSQVRAGWPDQPIKLFGAGVDSGTFDYFTEAIVGKEKASRGDYTSSEDDNVIVKGVEGDVNALGYFGMAYYHENTDKLKALEIDDQKPENGVGAQAATAENVIKGAYRPLSRPLFIYVRKASLAKPEIKTFVNYYLSNVAELTTEIGYVPLEEKIYKLAQARVEKNTVGSLYAGKDTHGMTLADVFGKES